MNKTTEEGAGISLRKQLIGGLAAFGLMAVLPFLSVSGNGSTQPRVSAKEEVSVLAVAVQQDTAADTPPSSAAQQDTAADTPQSSAAQQDTTPAQPTDTLTDQEKGEGVFRILDTHSGNIVTVDDRTFCYGAVAYEMPPSYEKEALKAQCVACYTHFSRWRQLQREQPDPELKGADFKADLSRNEYYFSDEALRDKWGTLYESCHQRLQEAVDECFGEVLREEDGTLLQVAYGALSSGVTEDAKDIFGFASEHLQSVASPFDRTAPSYCTTVQVSCDEMLRQLDGQDKTSVHAIGTPERTSAGTVLTVTIGTKTYTGAELRERFGLRSANFTLEDKGDSFVFTVLGYGHGVGMSQYGANEMAKQGASYHEILAHYYHFS